MRFEHWVANFMKRCGYPEAKRRLSQYQVSDGVDLDNTAPYAIQCKSGKRIEIMKAYEEAHGSAFLDQIPLLFFRYDNKKPMVVMSAEDFAKHIKNTKDE